MLGQGCILRPLNDIGPMPTYGYGWLQELVQVTSGHATNSASTTLGPGALQWHIPHLWGISDVHKLNNKLGDFELVRDPIVKGFGPHWRTALAYLTPQRLTTCSRIDASQRSTHSDRLAVLTFIKQLLPWVLM